MNAQTLKKFEEQLAYLKMKQELLEELISEVNESSGDRDIVGELKELKRDLLVDEVEIYGYKFSGFHRETREILVLAMDTAISVINSIFDFTFQKGDEKK